MREEPFNFTCLYLAQSITPKNRDGQEHLPTLCFKGKYVLPYVWCQTSVPLEFLTSTRRLMVHLFLTCLRANTLPHNRQAQPPFYLLMIIHQRYISYPLQSNNWRSHSINLSSGTGFCRAFRNRHSRMAPHLHSIPWCIKRALHSAGGYDKANLHIFC